MTNLNPNFDLRLTSIPESIRQVEPYVQQIKRRYHLSDELYFNILLVLTEAVNNSITHGNQSDPGKKVSVSLRRKASDNTLRFTIRDEGKGFNPASVPDPTLPNRIGCPNGRGVYLIHKIPDYAAYSDKGRRLEIRFQV